MLRLYLRFYFALVASLLLFVLATAALWHFTGGPMMQVSVTLGRLVQNALPAAGTPVEEQQRGLQRLSAGIQGAVTLYSADGTIIAAVGPLLPAPPKLRREHSEAYWDRAPISYVHLADGRWLAASLSTGGGSAKFIFHIALLVLAIAIGAAAFPLVKKISRRLERLQHGVESLGAGELTARVAVEGSDEVARLAASFNRAAGHIEQLVQGHKRLLANASHELRTPLARIRLAVELLKDSADPARRAGLEHDVAELDRLVDEILLASRLDTITEPIAREEIDLLALAAEECARYDDVNLEGSVVILPGDARLLRRLLRNLLENARRHGSPPTQVRINRDLTDAARPGVVILVWDHGTGVPASEFENVFRPFHRRKDAGEFGTGLGLSLVRQIALRHGGEARCGTVGEARSGFIVTLPG